MYFRHFADDIRLDETSSMEQAAVFRDLDTYLDAQLMNINFLGVPDCRLEDEPRRPWGVRGQSITCHTDFTDDNIIEQVTDLLPSMRIPLEQSTLKASSPPRNTRKRKVHAPNLRTVEPGCSVESSRLDEIENKIDWTGPVPTYAEPDQRLDDLVQNCSFLEPHTSLQFTPMRQRYTEAEGVDVDAVTEEMGVDLHTSPVDYVKPLESATVVDEPASDNPPSAMTVSLYDPVSPSRKPRRGRTSSGTSLLVAHARSSPPVQLPSSMNIQEHPCKTLTKKTTFESPTYSQCSIASDPMELVSHGFVDPIQSPSSCDGDHSKRIRGSPMSAHHSGSLPLDTERIRPLSPSSSDSATKHHLVIKRPNTLIPTNTGVVTVSQGLQSGQQRPLPVMRVKIPTHYARFGKFQTRFTSSSSASSGFEAVTQIAAHRSLSTSNLSGVSPGSPKTTTVAPSGTDTGPVPIQLGRFQSPVLKFHKNFTSKRQSLSAEDLTRLIRQPKVSFLVPTCALEVPGQEETETVSVIVPKSPMLSSSQSFPGKGSASSLHSPPTDSVAEAKITRSPQALNRLGLSRHSNSLPEPVSSRRMDQIGTTTQRSPANITPVVYHKLMTRTSLFSSVTYPWTEMVPIERTWLNSLKKLGLDESSNDTMDQLTSALSDLPSVFSALALRCQNGVRAALNLAGFSWDEASETTRLRTFCCFLAVSVSELLTTTVRPPYLLYTLKKPSNLTEREQSAIQSGTALLLESYEETGTAIQHLAKLAFDRDGTSIQRGCVTLLFKLASFLQATHTVAEQLYRACSPQRTARELSERLQRALDLLASSMNHYYSGSNSNYSHQGSTCSTAPTDPTEFTSMLVDQMDTLLRELSELGELGGTDPVPESLAVRLFKLVDLYHSRHISDSDRRLLTIDCVLGVFSLYVTQYFTRSENADSDATVVYLVVPSIGLGRTGSPSPLDQCSYLKQQLDTLC
ncbi:unnamed protein product [Echinostoma caproni]|uniref:WAPL domain-containing protein n=1 Tax=Echinostoma caproni TaxID=27848 RepID=A0A183AM43_9TREM|nr:unnamed protein product [Echinostoma caproni]